MHNACRNDPVTVDPYEAIVAELTLDQRPSLRPRRESAPSVPSGATGTASSALLMPFVGHAIAPVRASGVVRLPEFVRRTLVARASRSYLGLHETDACLVGFGQAWHERITSELGRRQLDRLEGGAVKGSDYARRVFGFCEEVWWPCESIRLSEWARAVASIGDTALFIGAGETFEIWSPDEAVASGQEALVALARSGAKFRAQSRPSKGNVE